MNHTKIETTEAVKRWNTQVELADLATWGLCDRMDAEQLPHYLKASGHEELCGCLIAAGKTLGYFGDGKPDNHRERPTVLRGAETKSVEFSERSNTSEVLIEAWDTCRSAADKIQEIFDDLENLQQRLTNRELCLRDEIRKRS